MDLSFGLSMGCSVVSLATDPGAKTATDISTETISRSFYPPETIGTAITTSGLTYQLWDGSAWTVAASSGTFDYPKMRVVTISSASYETLTEPTVTIDGTVYTFSVTTPTENASFPYTFPFKLG